MRGIEMNWSQVARAYLDLQQLRISAEHRIRKAEDEEIKKMLIEHHQRLKAEEKLLLKEIEKRIKQEFLWQWCLNVKGLGVVGALTFLGFINPERCDTAGKARAYLGLIPGVELKSGKKISFNPEAKGRIWLITRNIIMAKDPYYYELYTRKKEYYLNNERKVFYNGEWITFPPFKEILEDPTKCPFYMECVKKYKAKAERLGREAKPVSCRAHLDNMAKRWLASLLVAHATELMRRSLGLPVDNFKKHHNYIPPKGFS
ncbi:MAG: hypothetical protein ACP5KW_09415 [Thermoproteota archaeon]